MTLLDLMLVLVLVVLLPLQGWAELQGLVQALRRGDPEVRSRTLLSIIGLEWTLALSLLAGWQTAHRSWVGLGLTLPLDWRVAIGVAGIAAAAWLAWMQHRSVARLDPQRRRRLVARTGDSLLLLPVTPTEERIFAATALTAGVCEELLYRGFMFWILGHWMGTWAAVVVASVPFGLAHLYQGGKGVVRTGVVGLVIGALYAATGSLLWPMIAHATIDLGAGKLGPLLAPAMEKPEAEAAPEAVPAG